MPSSELPLEGDVEEVRAYLSTVRGGAPFLSSTDGHLLVSWLEAGIRVGAILRSIDRAAAKHRAKRVRAPLTLRHARSFLTKESGRGATSVPDDLPTRVVPVCAEGAPLEAALVATRERIRALDQGDAEERARAACAIARQFFEDVWENDPALRHQLHAEAEAELADLRDALDEGEFGAACEDLARYRLRQQFPSLSATRIWEECGLGSG